MLLFFCFLLSETVLHLLGSDFLIRLGTLRTGSFLWSLHFLHYCGGAHTACYFERALQDEHVSSDLIYLFSQLSFLRATDFCGLR